MVRSRLVRRCLGVWLPLRLRILRVLGVGLTLRFAVVRWLRRGLLLRVCVGQRLRGWVSLLLHGVRVGGRRISLGSARPGRVRRLEAVAHGRRPGLVPCLCSTHSGHEERDRVCHHCGTATSAALIVDRVHADAQTSHPMNPNAATAPNSPQICGAPINTTHRSAHLCDPGLTRTHSASSRDCPRRQPPRHP
jgi:hypothetical protein